MSAAGSHPQPRTGPPPGPSPGGDPDRSRDGSSFALLARDRYDLALRGGRGAFDLVRHSGHDLEVCTAGGVECLLRDLAPLLGEPHEAAAAVARVRAALDVAGRGQALQDVADAARGQEQRAGQLTGLEDVRLTGPVE